ncbi:MAG: phosphoethanolamine--lipid A transferase [Pseudomonadota bacterium]
MSSSVFRLLSHRLTKWPDIDYRLVLVALAFYVLAAFNWTLLRHFYAILGELDAYDPVFAATGPLVVFLGLMVVFMPFSFRPVLKPFFVFLILTSSLVTYGMIRYGIIFDREMIRNFSETSAVEAFSYATPMSVLWLVLTGIAPSILLMFLPVRYPASFYRGIGQRIVILAVALLCIGIIASGYFKDYASVGRNNKLLGKEIVPVNYFTGAIRYAKSLYREKSIPFQTIAEDARIVPPVSGNGKPTLMFLLIGETARAASVAANGYDRATTPFTRQLSNVIAFQDVRSCGTATAVSVPCMFSPMDRANYDETIARNSENLMDVVARAGASVLWKENDGGCKGVCDRIPSTTIAPEKFPDFCNDGTCFDEVMLQNIDDEIANLAVGDKLIAMHLIGSHGPTYYRRYPDSFRHFMPDCPRSDIENCTEQELVNTYDNTIRYTDFVIAQLIAKLEHYTDRYNPVLLYVSDHGESLGESGLYLHGAPYLFAPDEQTRVPMMVWIPDDFVNQRRLDGNCITKIAAQNSYSHDNLFSTVLGLMQVETALYNPGTDIFAPCASGTGNRMQP